ncbi:glycosyltransferase family 39 protein [Alkalicaulis satelles]|uniref:glycosyltransferase family 39 protein n=1 Tax=Alkalicaulis satelles TaxID=2609175 RepID=UPI0018EBCE9D|nr:glycosyltransferase family 39 protein [Alkalicaulis satelles]
MRAPDHERVSPWLWAAAGLAVAAGALWSLYLAANANLLWEEAYFRLAGRSPALGYADTPLGTPLLAALSEALFGSGKLGSRLLTWALSALLPLGVFFLAEPLTGRVRALIAAALSALVPPFVIAGVYAYPEGPLQLLAVVFAGCLIRALAGNKLAWWLAAGAVCAIGLLYHYRFWFAPAGVLVFLLAAQAGRAQWRNPKALAAGAVAVLGVIPSIAHNVLTDFGPLRFQALERQDWRFWPRGLLYPVEQAGLVTPVMFALLAGAAVLAVLRWRGGDARHALLVCMAGALFIPFAALALFDSRYLLHWPLMTYALLIVLAPEAAQRFHDALGQAWRRWTARVAAVIGAVLMAAGAIGFGVSLLIWQAPERFLEPDRFYTLQGGDLEDWSRFAPALERAFAQAGEGAVFAAADQVAGVQLRVTGGVTARAYMLDHPDDATRGVQTAHAPRGESEADLIAREGGSPAVVALREPFYLYRDLDAVAFRERLCAMFEDVRLVETARLPPGRVEASFFVARVREGGPAETSEPCAFLPHAILERPRPAERVSGVIPVYGVAAHPSGVERVEVLVDGEVKVTAWQRHDLPGWRFPPVLDFDPDYPQVYWDVRLDLDGVPSGRRTLSIRVVARGGESFITGERPLFVR